MNSDRFLLCHKRKTETECEEKYLREVDLGCLIFVIHTMVQENKNIFQSELFMIKKWMKKSGEKWKIKKNEKQLIFVVLMGKQWRAKSLKKDKKFKKKIILKIFRKKFF